MRPGKSVYYGVIVSLLKPGDSFNPQIEQYICKGCSCFLAVISQNTERRLEGYFRREWNLAVERDRGIYFAKKFIVPVIVDETAEPVAASRTR